MKNVNTMLLNKVENGATTTFTVWTDTVHEISSFIKKVLTVENIPDTLGYQHDIGAGYWVEISVPTTSFARVITDIKAVFENDDDNRLCEDFHQTYWCSDMLYNYPRIRTKWR